MTDSEYSGGYLVVETEQKKPGLSAGLFWFCAERVRLCGEQLLRGGGFVGLFGLGYGPVGVAYFEAGESPDSNVFA
jgi:hypothetical protein